MCDQRILAADGLSKDLRSADHLAGHGPVKSSERPELIDDCRIGSESPRDAAVLHELQRRGKTKGLATLCVSGGMGMAMAIECV